MRQQKQWLKNDGIIYTGFWEPIHFIRQKGDATENTASLLDFIKSKDFIKHLADIGVNQLWCNFSKGYGLTFEHEEQLKIKTMCEYAHEYGMRVIAYCTGGSLVPETVKYDVDDPDEVDDWLAKTLAGTWASYGNGSFQNFRARPCYSSPGYMTWQKKIINRALDYGCDGIHFDNTNILPEPAGCHCDRCVGLFREYLAEKYDPNDPAKKEAGLARWGRTDFRFAREPWFDNWNNPVMQREVVMANQQDWFLFRQKIFADALNEWADTIHERDGIVEYNTGKGFLNSYRMHGAINDEKILPKADIIFNEGTVQTGYSKSGAPLTRVRSHKIAQAFDLPVMTYNNDTIKMAEAFSFNPGMCGMWGRTDRLEQNDDRRAFFKWYHQYKHYQTHQKSLARVGIFMENDSLTFSQLNVYMALASLTQLLQEECIPFNLVYDKDLDDLSQYRLLIVPDMFCIKQRQADIMTEWVKGGGSLLTTGRTGIYDDHFQRRVKVKTVKSLDDLYHASDPENVFTPLTGQDYTSDFIMTAGKGMVAHIGKLEYFDAPNPGDPAEWCIRSELVRRPANGGVVMRFINELMPERELNVVSKEDLLVDICRRDDTGEGLIHLFNVSFLKGVEAAARVGFTWGEPVESLTWIGYDRDETSVEFRKNEGRIEFELDGIRESAVIIINKTPE